MRSVFTYLTLVGLPLAGLFVILRIGEGLEPPRAIGGDWRFTVTGATTDVDPCLAMFGGSKVRSISQSGRYLELTPGLGGGARSAATLIDGFLAATSVVDEGDVCSNRTLRLRGRFEGSEGSEVLLGALDLPECAVCGAIGVTAIRVEAEPGR